MKLYDNKSMLVKDAVSKIRCLIENTEINDIGSKYFHLLVWTELGNMSLQIDIIGSECKSTPNKFFDILSYEDYHCCLNVVFEEDVNSKLIIESDLNGIDEAWTLHQWIHGIDRSDAAALVRSLNHPALSLALGWQGPDHLKGMCGKTNNPLLGELALSVWKTRDEFLCFDDHATVVIAMEDVAGSWDSMPVSGICGWMSDFFPAPETDAHLNDISPNFKAVWK
ncbi:MAG: hypothetical protein EOM23_00230 [Candidatus Moranbacteria bacterium]|nr:hypothetical protein [Candidatus Moranbacteria bacterium]